MTKKWAKFQSACCLSLSRSARIIHDDPGFTYGAVALSFGRVRAPCGPGETAPALTAPSFGELAPTIMGYRQVSDATLLYLARVHGMKLITFDRPIAAVCPWPDHLELLTP